MNLVTKSTDVNYLHTLKGLLEGNGIPAVVNGENTARMVTPFVMTEPGLWVYIDEQVDEAIKLVSDPDYQVVNKVDVNEFYAITSKVTNNPGNLNTVLVNLGIFMGLIILGMFVLLMVLQWLSDS